MSRYLFEAILLNLSLGWAMVFKAHRMPKSNYYWSKNTELPNFLNIFWNIFLYPLLIIFLSDMLQHEYETVFLLGHL